jgi:putative membrane-bound dehydrogenase-like protein
VTLAEGKTRIIALEATENGFKVDWESWVGYSPIEWGRFVTEKMQEPSEFRAMIGRDDFYDFRYANSLEYRCYQIRDPEEKHRLWGYVERNGEIDRKLQRAMLRSPYAFLVVKLRYPSNNPKDEKGAQVEIVELVEEGWVLRDDNDPIEENGVFFFRDDNDTKETGAKDEEIGGVDEAVLSGKESATLAAKKMDVPEGFHIDFIAAEPDIVQPIAFTIDERGRLWVVEGNTYPKRAREGEGQDRILIFEDADHDGSFETRKVFMDGLNLVSGIEVGFGGVWIGSAPYLMFIPDRDKNDEPDGKPRVLLDGWGYQDTHETLNSFLWGPDGWLYGCHGVFTHSKVGKPGTPEEERVPLNCGYWRYHPIDHEFEVFAQGTSNPWGLDYDDYGQFFSEACVIPHFWHVIQGAYYLRQSNPLGHFNKNVFTNIETIADHRHYVGSNPHAGNEVSGSAGGGHAHSGLTIYLGDNFPAEYRNRPFFFNLHGHRMNQERLSRRGSGWVAMHAPDLMLSHDEQFMGVAVKYGPEGSLYFIDWHDKQTCHLKLPEAWDRSNGRIFRMRYGEHKVRKVDLSKKSDVDLARLQFHKNDWYVRTSRRLLQERLISTRGISGRAIRSLRAPMVEHDDVTRRLRALWALHAVRVLRQDDLIDLVRDKEEYMRAWAIQLLMEDRSVQKPPPAQVLHYLSYLAHKDPSPLVRLYVTSALQRLPYEHRWNVVEGLVLHEEDAGDHNLPQMIWVGAEPLVQQNPQRALRIALDSKIPLLTDHIARRAGATTKGADAVLDAVTRTNDPTLQNRLLGALVQSIHGRADVPMPPMWPKTFQSLKDRGDKTQDGLLLALAISFGDQSAFPMLLETLSKKSRPLDDRRRVFGILAKGKAPGLPKVLHGLLGEKVLRLEALKALAAYDEPATPGALLGGFKDFSREEARVAVNTLASRPSYAAQLLSAVERGALERGAVSSVAARQIKSLGDPKLVEKLAAVWGKVDESPAAIQEQIAGYKKKLTADLLKKADRRSGRAVFDQACASCHTLFGAGKEIGPELTGSNRADLDYILENILNPNAGIGKDYQLNLVTMKDGRVLAGMIRGETDSAVTLQLIDNVEVAPKSQIASIEPAPTSMMPPGLLSTLSEEQTQNLIAYLASPLQVPLPGQVFLDPKTGKVAGAIEGESLKIIAKTGNANPQSMGAYPLGKWSGDRHLWWTGAKPGDELVTEFDVSEAGNYDVFIGLTKAIDYGIVEVRIDGKEVGDPIDLFSNGVISTGPISLGVHELKAGPHQLSFKITGANPKAAKAYMVGLDYVWLGSVPER